MITLSRKIYDEMLAHAQSIKPVESCAYLAGTDNDVKLFIPMTNVENRADFFQFAPAEQFGALKQARAAGLQLISVYHSHPESPARFSEADKEWANDEQIVYMILSLMNEEADLKAFRVKSHEPIPEELTITE